MLYNNIGEMEYNDLKKTYKKVSLALISSVIFNESKSYMKLKLIINSFIFLLNVFSLISPLGHYGVTLID